MSFRGPGSGSFINVCKDGFSVSAGTIDHHLCIAFFQRAHAVLSESLSNMFVNEYWVVWTVSWNFFHAVGKRTHGATDVDFLRAETSNRFRFER